MCTELQGMNDDHINMDLWAVLKKPLFEKCHQSNEDSEKRITHKLLDDDVEKSPVILRNEETG